LRTAARLKIWSFLSRKSRGYPKGIENGVAPGFLLSLYRQPTGRRLKIEGLRRIYGTANIN
jgi:hypothetical protein